MPCELSTERHDTTLVLTLSDPANRNTLSPQACAAGIEALLGAGDDDAVRVVVLRGDGRHFCAGPDDVDADGLAALVDAVRASPKPVIAAVEGEAAGAGMTLALACDLVIAADDARFLPSPSTPLPALPRPLRLQWQWLPDSVPAARLLACGLLAATAPSGQVRAEALQWAARLAQRPAGAVQRS